MRTGARTGALVVALCLLEAACGANADRAPTVDGTINVYAAQSLANAFPELAKAFEAEHAGVHVSLNFAGSATLVTQITQGAPADVFASADRANVDRVVAAGLVEGTPTVFAENALEVVVAKGNPKAIKRLADLAAPQVATVLCAAAVPCGAYARQALGKAGVQVTPRSDESSVAGVIGRVQNGEADAGIVYVTDVRDDDKVAGVAIPLAQNVVVEYPEAVLEAAPNPVGARAFRAYVESPAGQRVLAKYGFLPLR